MFISNINNVCAALIAVGSKLWTGGKDGTISVWSHGGRQVVCVVVVVNRCLDIVLIRNDEQAGACARHKVAITALVWLPDNKVYVT